MTHAVSYGSLVEVQPLDAIQRTLQNVVNDPQRSSEGGADASATASRYKYNGMHINFVLSNNSLAGLSLSETHIPEFVSPKKYLTPASCAAVASPLNPLVYDTIPEWLISEARFVLAPLHADWG